MTQLQKVLSVIATLLAIFGGIGKYWTDATHTAIERDRLLSRVRVLERITMQEHPNYWPEFTEDK